MRVEQRLRAGLRKMALASGAAALLVALGFLVLKPGASHVGTFPSSSVAAPSSVELSETGPHALAGGWVLAGIDDWVLNRADNSYHQLPARSGALYLASPVGDLAAIVSDDHETNRRLIEIVTTTGAPVQTVRIASNGVYSWSPQGDRLVTGVWGGQDSGAPPGFGFAVIEARTGQVSTHHVDLSRFDCSMCHFTWSRGGDEVALGIAARGGGEARESFSGVQFFDARSGAPTRQVAMRAMFNGPFSWSPNGRYVIAQPDGLKDGFQVVDTTTFRTSPVPFDGVFVSDDLLLGVDGSTIVAMRPDGTVVQRIDLAGDFEELDATTTFGPP